MIEQLVDTIDVSPVPANAIRAVSALDSFRKIVFGQGCRRRASGQRDRQQQAQYHRTGECCRRLAGLLRIHSCCRSRRRRVSAAATRGAAASLLAQTRVVIPGRNSRRTAKRVAPPCSRRGDDTLWVELGTMTGGLRPFSDSAASVLRRYRAPDRSSTVFRIPAGSAGLARQRASSPGPVRSALDLEYPPVAIRIAWGPPVVLGALTGARRGALLCRDCLVGQFAARWDERRCSRRMLQPMHWEVSRWNPTEVERIRPSMRQLV